MKTLSKALIAAAAISLTPVAALAQDNMTTDVDRVTVQEDDDDDFPWGLLGLLGLAGLAGLKRREPDIRVDARRDNNIR